MKIDEGGWESLWVKGAGGVVRVVFDGVEVGLVWGELVWVLGKMV